MWTRLARRPYEAGETSAMAKAVRKTANGLARAKGALPDKPCAACGRPFAWRKKWARDWENVRYCSDRCRAAGGKAQNGIG
jgi:hypothetical protein